jgi:soluble lytic murein transglycosylase-like protein
MFALMLLGSVAYAPTPDVAYATVIRGKTNDLAQIVCSEAPAGLDRIIRDAGAEFGVDPVMLAVTIGRESNCNPFMLGTVGEIGLTQINPSVWKVPLREELGLELTDLWNIKNNVRASAWIFTTLSGNTETRFRKYNGSGEAARNYGKEQAEWLRNVYAR